MNVVMDFDDFCDEYSELDSLSELKKANGPGFKVTLFTIPDKCSLKFLQTVKSKYPWIQMAIHGWNHQGEGECLNWSRETAREFLQKALNMGYFVPGFKAPNWLANKEVYLACQDLGIWVAEMKSHIDLLPNGLQSYILELPKSEGIIQAHGHVSPYPQNYIKTHLSEYKFGRDVQYLFISELLEREKNNK